MNLQQHNPFYHTINFVFFANHGLHFKFDVQGVNNIVNQLKIKACGWWAFEHNLYPTLGRHKDITRKMLMNIAKINKISRLETKHNFDDKTSKHLNLRRNWTTKNLVHSPSWNKSILWHFNSNFQFPWKFILCLIFLIGTLPCIYHPKKNSWTTPTYENWLWTKIWSAGCL